MGRSRKRNRHSKKEQHAKDEPISSEDNQDSSVSDSEEMQSDTDLLDYHEILLVSISGEKIVSTFSRDSSLTWIVSNSLLKMYSATCLTLDNGSDCDLVERVFRTMHKRNVVAWNTMFSWYVKRKRFSKAVKYFVMMMRLGIKPIVVSFTNVFLADQYNIITHTKTYKLIFLKIEEIPVSEIGDFRVADVTFVFALMERDIVSWKTIVSALVQNELDNEDLMLLYEMKKLWVAIDDITITILLFAASNLRDREIGKQTHAYLLRHNIQFEGMESNLIDMYAKSNMIREEQAIFQWNAKIAGNTQNGLIEQPFAVFKEMLEQNVKPNDVTLASILQSCSQSRSIAIGKQLHYFAIHNLFENNVYIVSALVDMYSKSRIIDYAESVF
ncbi:pentatricopeptide repeat-containing protein At3g22150, chloroplastic-like [Solanum tuberosum]|uniref:pentatricopeptide repeat-containing protein At3g22150, chloroplastic-like n=1 Tax=Solanum tuberosum TaxID=4113 RepID=UPI00073A016A|nr:PREDICTED: pentatricopeptide repeat-containing protein At3g22150, chloroplastic-like [Solanum tuberosum]